MLGQKFWPKYKFIFLDQDQSLWFWYGLFQCRNIFNVISAPPPPIFKQWRIGSSRLRFTAELLFGFFRGPVSRKVSACFKVVVPIPCLSVASPFTCWLDTVSYKLFRRVTACSVSQIELRNCSVDFCSHFCGRTVEPCGFHSLSFPAEGWHVLTWPGQM